MTYVQQQADPKLRTAIRCYWKIENQTRVEQSYTILPDGFFDLLICYHRGALQEVSLSGLWDRKTQVTIAPQTVIYGVQFRLLAVETILQKSIAPLRNRLTQSNTAYRMFTAPPQKVASCSFEYLDRHFLTYANEAAQIDPRKETLLKTVNQSRGTLTVEAYAQRANWSRRQINRYFQATFGLSLKRYCGIRKGAAAYSQIKKGQLYPRQGYFDQPHFINGIKKITGYTPKVLLKNENDRFLQFSIIENS